MFSKPRSPINDKYWLITWIYSRIKERIPQVIAIGLIIIVVTTSLITDSDLKTFPFVSDVWGNMSEWAMVMVTCYTLYYLVETLKSQLEVQRLQAKITLIENEKYRRDSMPRFTVKIESLSHKYEDDQCLCEMLINYTLEDCHIQYVSIVLTSSNSNLTDNSPKQFYKHHIHVNSIFHHQYLITCPKDVYLSNGVQIAIDIYFIDPVNNRYSQKTLVLIKEQVETEIQTEREPTLIGS
ncbi:hypothetical protein OQY15_09965 [Pedobacter sp. MC2016-15]|uniref:hypothetical protein n=1 Tax=Pedobacter sp. MC2016-15 TaxID=2994473 RepID=UPI0022465C4E|nr:hypothetical protein [Pedobacter sp. MC2016-15]MCX2479415.1 hypothetical protein [Pedobacter sp. MC2016-15]